MRKRTFLLSLLLLFISGSVYAQKQVLNYKRLKDFLPKDIAAGFTMKKPTGETTSAMGMTTSYAEVRYEGKEVKTKTKTDEGEMEGTVTPSFEVKITDFISMPMAGYALSMMGESEKETETGYEKTTKFGSYPCSEKGEGEGEYKNFNISILVGNRFQIEIKGNSMKEVNPLYDVAKKMDLVGLEKEGNK
jgi:hypothetical protein